ncbi:fumarylacetoacetate hydrolase family protein [Methylobacterium sp. Leaf466]|uniref:fumarylacetoacetate hydrolase family protein n=1 Tax=Methylobacterium sp. Leaf466 TaxID=1736386 RepID=UPI0006F44BD6|nr:fumarylacetoacetate hydrolase family protein [Methylobacterium sp. Leaf466]KQT88759.1 2-hydroxyhepta-2,4-diene-1,7-dioate isomerase [Methylobacterium sp. Leaf466]
MARWISYRHEGRDGFGHLDGDTIAVFTGDLFGTPTATGETLAVAAVTTALPCRPSKLIALWNNFHAMADKQGLERPAAPLFFVKPPNTYCASGEAVAVPEGIGRILFEGELGIVVGKAGRDLTVAAAAGHIFGYTCVNDVTALDVLKADPSFVQWTRSKGLDGFGPFGPVIATGLDSDTLTVRVRVNGRERQSYPLSDIILKPAEIVSLVSQGMTLEPGDLIACGTSNGAGPIPKGATVAVEIEGIGVLENRFS